MQYALQTIAQCFYIKVKDDTQYTFLLHSYSVCYFVNKFILSLYLQRMLKHTEISDEVKQFVEKVICENGLESTEVQYGVGSEIGYTSKITTVDISGNQKSLHLFCKSPLGLSWHTVLPVEKMFANEIYFYNTIFPAYQEFLKEKDFKEDLTNVAKCYGIGDNMIALENLKLKGYDIFSKEGVMNDDHILFTMKALAKFHAISFAFKDQRRELYDRFTAAIHNCFTECLLNEGCHKVLPIEIREFLKTLDHTKDKHLLDASSDLENKLVDIVVNIDKYLSDYAIVIHGDFWSNNVMYLYDEEHKDKPIDVKLIDWQAIRTGSPTIDIAYFFYPIASESTINKLEYYLEVYYNELSENIKRLGSDPKVLYPFPVLQEEWKKYARYSFALSFPNIKSLLAKSGEMPNLEDHPKYVEKLLDAGEDAAKLIWKIKDEYLYMDRLKIIFKHFIENNFL